PDARLQDTFSVVLTREPEDSVRVTIVPAAVSQAGGGLIRGISVNANPLTELNNPGVTLVFTKRNWFIPQVVTVTALPDAVAEGTRFIGIQFSTVEGDDPGARVVTSTSGSTVSVGTNATRGTLTITANDETTNLIAFDADATTIRQKLEALSSIGAGHVSVLGTGTIDDPWRITFTGVAVPVLTVDNRRIFSAYDALPIRTIVAEVVDDDAPAVIVTPLDANGVADGVTRVLEGGF